VATMTQWIFERLAGAAVRRDPNETQLFKTEQTEEGEYAGTDALVREILQNTLDAATGDGPVRLRLALHSASDLPPPERLAAYFGRLREPLRRREIDFSPADVPLLPEGFLVCEDFGTRGLGGDPLLAKDPIPSSSQREDFFWFWRNIGRSGKTGDDLGRWGLGKTVYRAASQVGCMLGLTVRASDGRELLMGQAVLGIHERDGVEYVPEGFWCDGVNELGLPLPIERPDELERFRREWRLTRAPDQPGLSVVVPYVASELKGARILQAICVHFFLPILRGELVVDLVAPDIPAVSLDSESIAGRCREIVWDGPKRTKRHVAPPIDFIRECLRAEANAVPTRVLGQDKLPELSPDAFEPGVFEGLRQALADERLVAVRVRMALPRRRGADAIGELCVFVRRRPDANQVDTYFCREGMTITKLNASARFKGIRGFVVVEPGPLAQLLGDSEGPAHEDWDTSEERPNRIWSKWKGRVKFCRRVVDSMVEMLTPVQTRSDFDLLSDFFSIERPAGPQSAMAKTAGTIEEAAAVAIEEPPPDPGEITPRPHWYRLTGRRGGFRIVRNADNPVPENPRLRVSVAYDLPTGNPLKRWSPFDFDFGRSPELRYRGAKVQVRRVSGNVLTVQIDHEMFSFSIDGFDPHRDLLVRIDEVSEPTAEAAESPETSTMDETPESESVGGLM